MEPCDCALCAVSRRAARRNCLVCLRAKTVDTTTVKSAVTVSGARDGEGRALEFVIW